MDQNNNMFASFTDFLQLAREAVKFINYKTEFEAELQQFLDSILSDENSTYIKFSAILTLKDKMLLNLYIQYDDNHSIKSYFVLKRYDDNKFVDIHECFEMFDPELTSKLHLDLRRAELVNFSLFDNRIVYRINDCGIKEEFQLLLNKHNAQTPKINVIVMWMSIILKYFHLYFSINQLE